MAKALGELYTVVTSESIAANDSWSQSSSFIDVKSQHILGVEITAISNGTESVTDEEMSFISPATTYDTTHEDLSSVVVTSADGLTTFTVDVDYSVNTDTGVITFIDSGTSGWANDGTVYHLDYDYTPEVTGDVTIKALKSLDSDVFENEENAEIETILTNIDYNGTVEIITVPVLGVEKIKFYVENGDALNSVAVTIKCKNTIL